MGISLTGVFTGIDTNAIVTQLMAVESRPLVGLQAQKDDWESKLAAVEGIESRLEQLRDLANSLRDADDLRMMYSSTSDKSVVTASVSEGAGEGSHEIHVEQLAKAHRLVHTNGLDELTTLVGTGQFVYTYDGQARTILTTAETTLEDLQDLINNDSGNPGVTGSIMEFNSDYYLTLSGNDSGTDHTINMDFVATDLVDFNEPTEWTTTQAAQNSKIRMDGFPVNPADYIERSSNTITDVLTGVTLNLVATGDATVTLTRDTDTLKHNLTNLVNIYNGIVSKMDQYTGYDLEKQEGGILQGDGTLNAILNQIRTLLTGRVTGFADGEDTYSLPAQIGLEIDSNAVELDDEGNLVSMNVTGMLSLDEETFNDAISQNYDAVLALIGAVGTGATSNSRIQFTSADASTAPGTYEVMVTLSGAEIATAKIRQTGESEWRDMDIDGDVITGKEDTPEQWLTLTVDTSGGFISLLPIEVRVRKGFAGQLYDYLDGVLAAAARSGVMATKKTRYEGAIENVDRKMEVMVERLDDKEERLLKRFARMEAALARLDAQRGAFESLFQSLDAMSTARRWNG